MNKIGSQNFATQPQWRTDCENFKSIDENWREKKEFLYNGIFPLKKTTNFCIVRMKKKLPSPLPAKSYLVTMWRT